MRFMVPLFVMALAAGAGCSDDNDCSSDSDCPSGRICRLGLCALDPNQTDVPSDGVQSDVPLNCQNAVQGDLVLNEILADPPANADIDGNGIASTTEDEFVEIVNTSTREVALSNVEIDVNGKRFAAGHLCLGPNVARVLFGSSGLPGLTNSSGTVSLVIDGNVVQSHSYGSEAGKDSSLTLATQLDPSSPWVLHEEVWGTPYSVGTCSNGNEFPNCAGGDLPDGDVVGGDGEVVAACSQAPVVGDLIINEVLADPGSGLDGNDANGDGVVDSSADEFVEIVNVSDATLLMAGVTLHDGGSNTYAFPATTCVAPQQAILVFGEYDGTGSFPDAVALSGGGLSLNNDGDSVFLRNLDSEVLAEMSYGAEANSDQSIVRLTDLDPEALFVKHSQAPNADGRTMSPGTCQNGNAFPNCQGGAEVVEVVEEDVVIADETVMETIDTVITDTVMDEEVGPTCGPSPVAGDLVINEVLFDPPSDYDANGDGTPNTTQDEFVEVVNASGGAVNATGLQIGDANNASNFTVGDLCLQPGEALIVFGKGTKHASLGGLVTLDEDTHALSFNNSPPETVRVSDAAGEILASEVFESIPADQSAARSPDVTGPFASHKDVSGGAPASPGNCLDGAAFPGCLP